MTCPFNITVHSSPIISFSLTKAQVQLILDSVNVDSNPKDLEMHNRACSIVNGWLTCIERTEEWLQAEITLIEIGVTAAQIVYNSTTISSMFTGLDLKFILDFRIAMFRAINYALESSFDVEIAS